MGIGSAAGTSIEEVLKRTYLKWTVVRISYQVRHFLAAAPQHFVRLATIFRFLNALIMTLPSAALAELLNPLLSSLLRCSTALANCGEPPPHVKSMADAMELGTRQRLAFLAQLAQHTQDALETNMRESGHQAEFAKVLGLIRGAVSKQRMERHQKKKLLPVTDPQAAAKRKLSKNLRRAESKKKKVKEMQLKRKGGVSSKKHRTLEE